MGYIEDIRSIVGHRPLILVGSVVIIINEHGEILMQRRKHPYGVWGLPGGLMELGESTEDTAIREVFEETGLIVNNLKLIDVFSGKENFCVAQNGDEFYVVAVAYFTKEYTGCLKVDDEESLECRFVNIHELNDNIVKSHKRMLSRYFEITQYV